MRSLQIVLLSLISFIIQAQNLVKNPGFEEYTKCPEGEGPRGNWNGFVKDWGSINRTTASYPPSPGYYFRVDCFKEFAFDSLYWFTQKDSIMPYEGLAMAQINLTSLGDRNSNRKYAYYFTKLKEPLIKDSTYRVEYYVHWNRFYQISDHFGVTFIRDTSEIYAQNGYQYLTDDYVGIRDTFLGPDLLWHKVEGCYTAKGGEEWLLLGEFIPAEEIHIHPWEPLWGLNGTGGFIPMMDNFYVGKASSVAEDDYSMKVCDGEEITLPSPQNPNTKIVDENGNEAKSVYVDWPNSYTFYFEDACYGILGSIEVGSEICIDMIDTTIVICDNQKLALTKILSEDYEIIDRDGNIVISFESGETGNYEMIARHKKYGEWGRIKIEVVACDDCKLIVPNILSLSSTNANNIWMPLSKCSFETFQVAIFDRWGNQVFRSEDPNIGWEGRYNGAMCSVGVYLYQIKYKFKHPVIPQNEKIKYGDITLIR